MRFAGVWSCVHDHTCWSGAENKCLWKSSVGNSTRYFCHQLLQLACKWSKLSFKHPRRQWINEMWYFYQVTVISRDRNFKLCVISSFGTTTSKAIEIKISVTKSRYSRMSNIIWHAANGIMIISSNMWSFPHYFALIETVISIHVYCSFRASHIKSGYVGVPQGRSLPLDYKKANGLHLDFRVHHSSDIQRDRGWGIH